MENTLLKQIDDAIYEARENEREFNPEDFAVQLNQEEYKVFQKEVEELIKPLPSSTTDLKVHLQYYQGVMIIPVGKTTRKLCKESLFNSTFDGKRIFFGKENILVRQLQVKGTKYLPIFD